ncbi:DUF2970 domain-containing protein [Plasticicumulans acidivorans]|uniref:DUF2970 family protein n=1 Tax=Plasticicumulans acidivorans TaxID=886464 RepID=A0A317MRQ3_9GAMM|nr:DUF2970 domain-containing protein [Plasticicumulans acidivorans]PWV59555.1 hypothetical protein C7443_110100 [Plasticicumulans acidivorans]
MNEPREPAPSLWQVIKSVLWAFVGVQKDANRRRDFSRGRAGQFIVVGLLATVVFVLLLIGLVQLVLHLAGA